MGLSITVGALADMMKYDGEGAEWIRANLTKVNAILESEGLGTFVEPESVELGNRCSMMSGSYSWLHYLRRAYAHHVNGRPVDVILGADNPTQDGLTLDETMMMSSHLLCHSDAEGFYAPVEFSEIIFDDSLPGAMMGSSYRLRSELAAVAPALGIELVDGMLSDAEAERLNKTAPGAVGEAELWSWLSHWEAARLSIEHSCMIVYN